MRKDWLDAQLEAGKSFEEIGRQLGRDPSTVAYWAEKHGLESRHAEKHRAKGPISKEVLEGLLARGLSLRAMASELDRSYTAIRYWMAEHRLETPRAKRLRLTADMRREGHTEATIDCATHGPVKHILRADGGVRCLECRKDAVARRRREVKRILVAEAGGCCSLCGFDDYLGALQFHHLEPRSKEFALAERGLTRALERVRAEAAKCVLLCANCHAKVEAGVSQLPFPPPAPACPG